VLLESGTLECPSKQRNEKILLHLCQSIKNLNFEIDLSFMTQKNSPPNVEPKIQTNKRLWKEELLQRIQHIGEITNDASLNTVDKVTILNERHFQALKILSSFFQTIFL
jgi:hypothetical protein